MKILTKQRQDYYKKYYQEHKQVMNATTIRNQKIYDLKLKEKVFDKFNNCCQKCGLKNNLQLHHKYYAKNSIRPNSNGETRLHQIKRKREALLYPGRFNLLCLSCHNSIDPKKKKLVSLAEFEKISRYGEKEIEFEKKESEFLSPKDLVNKSGIVLKILDEIQNQRTDFGPKATGTVEYTDGIETVKKIMRFNQIMINHLIDVTKSKDSKKWIGAKIAIQIDVIKGNHAIVPKEN